MTEKLEEMEDLTGIEPVRLYNAEQYFNKEGCMNRPIYQVYRSEYLNMKHAFIANDLETALKHEKNIMHFLNFVLNEHIKDEIEFELYESKYTQLQHKYLKKKTLHALELKARKQKQEDIDE